jgi:hypothetical protein
MAHNARVVGAGGAHASAGVSVSGRKIKAVTTLTPNGMGHPLGEWRVVLRLQRGWRLLQRPQLLPLSRTGLAAAAAH